MGARRVTIFVIALFLIIWQYSVGRWGIIVAVAQPSGEQSAHLLWGALRFDQLKHRLDASIDAVPEQARIEPELVKVIGDSPVASLSVDFTNVAAARLQLKLYPVVQRYRECPAKDAPALLVTSINSAELIKHASNCFLALKISYANLIANIWESVGAEIDEVVRGMGLDPRIGPAFLRPGLGFGALFTQGCASVHPIREDAGVDVSLLRDAELINRRRIDDFLGKARHLLWTLRDKSIGVLGLAFKPNTDDIRSAPAMALIGKLVQERAQIRVYDPQAMGKTRALFPSIHYCTDPYELTDGAAALMIVTEWDSFKELDWRRMKSLMQRPLILDGRNLLNGDIMLAMGFEYQGIGMSIAHSRGNKSEVGQLR